MGQPSEPNTWPSPDQPTGSQAPIPPPSAAPSQPWPGQQPPQPQQAQPQQSQPQQSTWPQQGQPQQSQPQQSTWPQHGQPQHGQPQHAQQAWPPQPVWSDPSGAPPAQAPPIAPPQQSFGQSSGQSMYGVRPDLQQPAPPQQGGYGQFTFPTPPKQKVEPLAVAGVATAPLGLVAVVLGLVARARVKRTRRRSMGLAWTAIALGTVFTIGWVMVGAVLVGNGTLDRAFESPQPGDVAEARTIASANLAVGNCIATLPPASEVGEVRLVPCAESHIAQVVSQHPIDGAYPGPDQLTAQATEICDAEIAALDAGEESIGSWFLVPSQQGWAQGNTRVICLLRGAAGPLTTNLVN